MDRILVCLDASQRAEAVLREAMEIARRSGGKMILLRAVGVPIEVPLEAYSMSPDAVGVLLENEAKKYLERTAATVPPELLERTIVAVGTPWRTICHTADTEGVNLIVVGSHGYNVLDRLIGTTAAKVVNHAKQSVLVVRSPEQA